MKQLLNIERLSVDFETPNGRLNVIHKVDLQIGQGEIVCLVGESGSGKTITSLSIMRLIDYDNGRITQGDITLHGRSVAALSSKEISELRGKKIAMIFQEPMTALDPVFTIGRQITEVIRRHKAVNAGTAWQEAVDLLRKVGIPEPEIRMKQYPYELSGGMRQRVMIAIALACGPDLLIADEPTTALDVTIQSQILSLLQELRTEFNMSILLITHDLGIAAEMADRIVVMYAGKVVEQAGVHALFEQPFHPYTQGLLQSIVRLDTERRTPLYTISGTIPSLSQLPSGCRFHPRCPHATERCMTEEPSLQDYGGREAACWHAERLRAEAVWQKPSAASAEQPAAGLQQAFAQAAPQQQAAEAEAHAASLTGRAAEAHAAEAWSRSRQAERHEEPSAAGIGPAGATPNVRRDGTAPGREADTALIEVKALTKYFPIRKGLLGRSTGNIRAVDDVSFQIRKGETFGLVGESGCGKSTLGRVLLQLDRATSGQILFEGRDLLALGSKELKARRRDMQMVFQDPYGSVNPRWRVGDIIGEPFWVHESLRGAAKRDKVEAVMKLVGLNPGWYERYPHEFSGGQRQRIGIARAIALNPKFILADEAVSALDVSVQSQVINLLQELQDRLGLTYLFIAHGLNIVRHTSDRIGVMYLGKLVEIAPTDELFSHPAHHYTRALLSAIPVADPAHKRTLAAIEGEMPSPANPPSGCRFHTRCPAATARCKTEAPELQPIGPGHYAACHYPA